MNQPAKPRVVRVSAISRAIALMTLLALVSAPFCGSLCAINSCSTAIYNSIAEHCHQGQLDNRQPRVVVGSTHMNCGAMPVPVAIFASTNFGNFKNVVFTQRIAADVNFAGDHSLLQFLMIGISPPGARSKRDLQGSLFLQGTVLRI